MAKEDVKSVKDSVRKVLKKSQRARDDDKYLVFRVYLEMGYADVDLQNDTIEIDKEKLSEMPTFESITRCRRKFQSEGHFKPSDKVQKKRREAEKDMREIDSWFDERRRSS